MTGNERRLLKILIASIFCAGVALAASAYIDHYLAVRADNARIEAQIERLSALGGGEADARARLEAASSRLDSVHHLMNGMDSDSAEFCRSIADLLASEGISPAGYRAADGGLFEFSFETTPRRLFSFMRAASQERGWRIPSADFRPSGNSSQLTVVLRIGQ